MELRHLRYFVSVAELGSVTRAAEKLFIAQPALSQQVRQLEEEIGARLLERLPRGVRLTAAGASFLEDARAILARAEQATVRARERHAGQRSTFRLSLAPTTTHSVLPAVLQRLRAQGVPAELEAWEMITSQQVEALRNREIDLALSRPGEEVLPLESLASIDDPYCLAIPAANPLARHRGMLPLKLAAGEAFVGFSRHRESDFFDRTTALCMEAGFRPRIRHQATQFVNVLALVSYGLGVAIVPASSALLPVPRVIFRRLQPSGLRSRLVVLRAPRARHEEWEEQVCAIVVAETKTLGKRLAALKC
jgi:DNA-binding transcriptional LysR family regulator